VLDPETKTAPAPMVKTEELATLPVKVTVPVLTVRAVVRVAPVTEPAVRPEAVPVKLVATPPDGVPRAPPLVTNDPAVPTLRPRAVATPVPNEVMPVPPLAIAKVPPRVSVPVVVIGPPVRVRPVVPPAPETEVTEPVPRPRLEVALQRVDVPVERRI